MTIAATAPRAGLAALGMGTAVMTTGMLVEKGQEAVKASPHPSAAPGAFIGWGLITGAVSLSGVSGGAYAVLAGRQLQGAAGAALRGVGSVVMAATGGIAAASLTGAAAGIGAIQIHRATH